MSYTEIYSFDKKGNASQAAEIRNAFRGAMAVWKRLEEKHLPPYRPSYVPAFIPDDRVEEFLRYKPSRCTAMMDDGAMKEIWNLADNRDVPENERIILFTTFDKCLVKKEDLPAVISAFRSFDAETSLPEQAGVLEQLLQDEDCIAVGWNQTSVNGDTWANFEYDEENDECIPYNCMNGEEHYWLFDELRKGGQTEEAQK